MKLTIIGASGHGKVAADIAERLGYDEIRFLDDREGLTFCERWPVLGTTDLAEELDGDFFVAIGKPGARKAVTQRLAGKRLVTLIHPKAVINSNVEIGEGSIVVAGAVINPFTKLGRGCIVNTCASVGHDCVLGDFVHIAPGARVCGTSTIGDGVWLGAGGTVINNVEICADCMIGAGGVVTKNLTEPGTWVGVPVRKL